MSGLPNCSSSVLRCSRCQVSGGFASTRLTALIKLKLCVTSVSFTLFTWVAVGRARSSTNQKVMFIKVSVSQLFEQKYLSVI